MRPCLVTSSLLQRRWGSHSWELINQNSAGLGMISMDFGPDFGMISICWNTFSSEVWRVSYLRLWNKSQHHNVDKQNGDSTTALLMLSCLVRSWGEGQSQNPNAKQRGWGLHSSRNFCGQAAKFGQPEIKLLGSRG